MNTNTHFEVALPSALKGRNTIAQGVALGINVQTKPSPERVKYSRGVRMASLFRPFRAQYDFITQTQGVALGINAQTNSSPERATYPRGVRRLFCSAPSGLNLGFVPHTQGNALGILGMQFAHFSSPERA